MSSDLAGIRNAFETHYRRFFEKSQLLSGRSSASNLIRSLPQLEDKEHNLLYEEISLNEVTGATDALPVSRTPGPDGISAEFYEVYKDMLCLYIL